VNRRQESGKSFPHTTPIRDEDISTGYPGLQSNVQLRIMKWAFCMLGGDIEDFNILQKDATTDIGGMTLDAHYGSQASNDPANDRRKYCPPRLVFDVYLTAYYDFNDPLNNGIQTREVSVPMPELVGGISDLSVIFRHGQNDFQHVDGVRSVAMGDIIMYRPDGKKGDSPAVPYFVTAPGFVALTNKQLDKITYCSAQQRQLVALNSDWSILD
jgi:hypothetical protein